MITVVDYVKLVSKLWKLIFILNRCKLLPGGRKSSQKLACFEK